MKRAATVALAIACVGLSACARDLDTPNPEPDPPRTVNFQLQNDGATERVAQARGIGRAPQIQQEEQDCEAGPGVEGAEGAEGDVPA